MAKEQNEIIVKALRPKSMRFTGEKESLRVYCRRARSLVPNIPISILVQWFWRHYQFMIHRWQWLPLDRLSFRREIWSTQQILSLPVIDPEYIKAYRAALFSPKFPQKTRLEQFMLRRGTFPRPIIILETATIEGRDALPRPFLLAEGNRRVAYLAELENRALARATHRVWIASVPSAA